MIETYKNTNESTLSTMGIVLGSGLLLAAIIESAKLIYDDVKLKKYVKIAKEYYRVTNPDFNIIEYSTTNMSSDNIIKILQKMGAYDENYIYTGRVFNKKPSQQLKTIDDMTMIGIVIKRYKRSSINKKNR